jgi:ketosteroid isomerase-like protein
MKQIVSTLLLTLGIHQALMFTVAAASREAVPRALAEMADTERAFVQRAQEAGAKQAFLEYFADTAVGFETGQPTPAKEGIRRQPDPPAGVKILFWWEPRYGDIAASGDLGWLTGPVQSARDDGPVRHGNYTSIWKRQPDGTFKVIIDVGIDPTAEVPFPHGFTRAPLADRYTGAQIAPLAHASLLSADRALNAAGRTSAADAYGAALAPAGRMHRNGQLPMRREAALEWLRTQPPFTGAESLYAEAARSADLGYTWGSYDSGHYVRVWVREASGRWLVALDVTQPTRPQKKPGTA